MSPAGDRDSDCCNPDLRISLSRRQRETPRVAKRKVDDTDIEPDGIGDDTDLEAEDASVKIKSPVSPPQKRAKCEDPSGPSLSAPPDPTLGCISAGCMPERQDIRCRRVDNEGYIIEATKERSTYTKRDLPVPCDQRWSHSFISTAILWFSVQNNIWNVTEEEFASALQTIFNVVYPGIKYRVAPTGSVFAVVSRFILSTLPRPSVLTRTDAATYPRVAEQLWFVRAGDDVALFLLARR